MSCFYECADSRADRSVMAPFHAERHAEVSTALTVSPCRKCSDRENPKNLPPCSTCERRARAAGFKRLDDAFSVFSAPDPGTQLVGKQAHLRGVRERAIKMFREGVPPNEIHTLVETEQPRNTFLRMMRAYYPEFRWSDHCRDGSPEACAACPLADNCENREDVP